MSLIIGLAGKIGSGKTAIAAYITEKYNAPVYRFSQILLDILQRLHMEPTRENFQGIGACLRRGMNESVVVNAMKKDLEKEKAVIIVVDGLRYMNEVEMLRTFEHNILIGIDAPPEVRYTRCVERSEKGEEKKSFEEFLDSEQQETERQLVKVMEKVDHRIDNSLSKEDMMKRIDEILGKVVYV